MTGNVVKAEADWRSRRDAEGYVVPPERLVLVRDRLAEAVRVLDTLHTRASASQVLPHRLICNVLGFSNRVAPVVKAVVTSARSVDAVCADRAKAR
jgi:hypothetical protein